MAKHSEGEGSRLSKRSSTQRDSDYLTYLSTERESSISETTRTAVGSSLVRRDSGAATGATTTDQEGATSTCISFETAATPGSFGSRVMPSTSSVVSKKTYPISESEGGDADEEENGPFGRFEKVRFYEHPDPVHGDDETFKLLYAHHECEVKRYVELPKRGAKTFKVTRVLSPYFFIIEYDYDKPLLGHKDWRTAMQEFYSSEEKRRTYQVVTSILLKYRCYACKDPDSGTWERVRMIKYDTKTTNAEVYFFELHEFRIVPRSTIFELAKEFTAWTCQSYPAHVLSVQPLGGSPYWSAESIEEFKKLVEGKSFYSVAVRRTPLPFPEGIPDQVEYLGVNMVEKKVKGGKTLAAQMVEKGIAEATGIFAASDSTILHRREGLVLFPTFDLHEFSILPREAFTTESFICTTDPPTAPAVKKLLEKSLQDGEKMRRTCERRGLALLPGERAETQTDFLPDMLPRHKLTNRPNDIMPNQIRSAMMQIRFASVNSPSCVYVQLENCMDELRQLETALCMMLESTAPIEADDAIPGTFLACLVQIDRFREPTWLRGVVRNTAPGSNAIVKVILFDYGCEFSVRPAFCRHLPKYFQEIPGFAFRIHLESNMMVPSGGKAWSQDAGEAFRKYMSIWNNVVPVYYGWCPSTVSIVPLDDYNQELYWEPAAHRWKPSIISVSPLNASINKLKNHPLLRNMYSSLGVEVFYEFVGDWKYPDHIFENLADMLEELGHGVRLIPVKDMIDQHLSITTAVTSLAYLKKQKDICNGKI